MTKKLTKENISRWYQDPITEHILAICKEIYQRDAAEITTRLNISRDPSLVGMEMAEFKGRQQMLFALLEEELFVNFLDEYIVEETIEDGTTDRASSRS